MSTERIEVVGVEAIVRDLAKCAAAEQILTAAKATLKARLQQELRQGTVYAFDDQDTQLDMRRSRSRRSRSRRSRSTTRRGCWCGRWRCSVSRR
ncbi:hypothetical protein [Rhodococcus jostii]|uniref:hypothetical protein n=1 Tax=Rhodococcus jostii TaxID=132919 RepID=UPI0036251139